MKLSFIFLTALVLWFNTKTIVVHHPVFAKVQFFEDSLRYVQFFDYKKELIYPEKDDFIKQVDSCKVYMVYNIKGGYHPFTVLQDNPNKIIETYKRKSNNSWIRTKANIIDILIEDRKSIVSVDTFTAIDPIYPEEITKTIVRYYNVK